MAAPGIVEILGIAASVSLLAGWRLYLCVLATGIAMRLGGGGALLSHGGKAGARAVVNASPEPFNNIAASTVEDVATAPPASRIRPGWRAALLPGYPAPACAAAGSRVFHSDQPIPAARIANVTPSDTGGGILTRPNISATKILAPINTSSTARAYFR